jgi:hypothetical protein
MCWQLNRCLNINISHLDIAASRSIKVKTSKGYIVSPPYNWSILTLLSGDQATLAK